MAFDKLKKSGVAQENSGYEKPYTVVAYNKLHQGQWFGQISNGGGTLAIDRNYGLRFIRDGSDFVRVELLRYGVQQCATTQTWNRTKKVVEKVEVQRKPKQQEGQAIEIDTEVEEESLF